MRTIENRRSERSRNAMRREAITAASAIGFLAGGGARMVTGLGDGQRVLFEALSLSLGAIAAAVLAGIVVNLIALPALSWVLPGRRLPARAYRVAGALSGVAAFASAFVQFTPLAV
ncbi:hypothetical protein [Methylobacterium pseudosasicola]|uniref:Uncharacterized protein n=1 Tax=Methylobacterium pseudosasicola TaxID=582667 RepID=A0A1I4NNH3_9HYPH|nr:hypothetical protein [Methylobacterium pseudosasicola]SFM17072.1 hypothetical protein SAMN05192568_102198 [Methylobacterium pseudosasicola]